MDRSCDSEDDIEPAAATEEPSPDVSEEAEAEEPEVEEAAATKPKPAKAKRERRSAAVAESFVMPALVGMNLQRAQNQLQARGSFLLTQTDGTGQGRFQMLDYGWKVCAQDPPAGTVTDIVTLVELVAVKLHEAC